MIQVNCLKCGKESDFASAASIWTAGWEPVTQDQYVCDICSQLEFDYPHKFEQSLGRLSPTSTPSKKKPSIHSTK